MPTDMHSEGLGKIPNHPCLLRSSCTLCCLIRHFGCSPHRISLWPFPLTRQVFLPYLAVVGVLYGADKLMWAVFGLRGVDTLDIRVSESAASIRFPRHAAATCLGRYQLASYVCVALLRLLSGNSLSLPGLSCVFVFGERDRER